MFSLIYLGALTTLEYNVKKRKSSKTSPGPTLSKTQINSTFFIF